MSKLLEGKTAIITGSNRGIGREILQVFAENGAAGAEECDFCHGGLSAID